MLGTLDFTVSEHQAPFNFSCNTVSLVCCLVLPSKLLKVDHTTSASLQFCYVT